jgi:hypothetical protein
MTTDREHGLEVRPIKLCNTACIGVGVFACMCMSWPVRLKHL